MKLKLFFALTAKQFFISSANLIFSSKRFFILSAKTSNSSLTRNFDSSNETIDVDEIVVRRSIKFAASSTKSISSSVAIISKKFLRSNDLFTSITKQSRNSRKFEQSNEIINVDEIIIRRSTEVAVAQAIDENLSQNVIFKTKKIVTNINFQLHDELIYHVKKNIFRLCISSNCEQNVFQLAHDDCFHAKHHRVYARLIEFVYVHKLFKKLITYIRHCSTCQLNQIKRHRSYEKLTPLFIFSIFFHTLIMN